MENSNTVNVVVGAALAVLAAIGSNLGVNVQKKSHMNNEANKDAKYYKQCVHAILDFC